ncbi:hypothetical protein C8T65DRAFT_694256 [Cerioporus squamosus]|nr:hypothetical protein C8T65DRAFT_694256 [Cerioporus squamosus]
MLAVHALFALGVLSAGVAPTLSAPPLRPVRSRFLDSQVESHSSHGSRPRHPLTHDTCLYANATTLSDITFSGLSSESSSTDFADLGTCLCLSGLSTTLDGLSSTASLVDEVGLHEVEQVFGTYITSSSSAKACTYPPNSKPTCTRDNLCGFSCNPPFEAVGDSCVCVSSSGCGSTPPPVTCQASGKTRRLSKRSTISTLAMAQSACEHDETVCGAFDGATANFQCVDVQTRLDSCGGCMMPNPFGFRVNDRASGVDCTAIPFVDSVSCSVGRCVVQSCLSGWTVDAQGTGCMQEQSIRGDASTLLVQTLRRSLALESHHNGTGDDNGHNLKPHSDVSWRVPDIRSEVVHEDRTQPASMQFKEDWTRIPDYRRHA